MKLFSETRAKLDNAASTVQNVAWLAVIALAASVVALFAALTHRS